MIYKKSLKNSGIFIKLTHNISGDSLKTATHNLRSVYGRK